MSDLLLRLVHHLSRVIYHPYEILIVTALFSCCWVLVSVVIKDLEREIGVKELNAPWYPVGDGRMGPLPLAIPDALAGVVRTNKTRLHLVLKLDWEISKPQSRTHWPASHWARDRLLPRWRSAISMCCKLSAIAQYPWKATDRRALIRTGFVTFITRWSTKTRILFPAEVVRSCSKVEGRWISSTK